MHKSKGQYVVLRPLGWATLLVALALFGIVRLLSRESSGHGPIAHAYEERASTREVSNQEFQVETSVPVVAETSAEPHAEASKIPIGPLSSLEESVEQRSVLHEAEEELIASCMRQKGFDYTTSPLIAEEQIFEQPPRFDPADTGAASMTGYGLADAFEFGEPELPVDANDDRREKMSESQRSAWDIALSGIRVDPTDPEAMAKHPSLRQLDTPTGGITVWDSDACISRARAALYGDDTYVELDIALKYLRNAAIGRAKSDPKQVTAQAKWRQCMSSKGHEFEFPGAASALLVRDYQQQRLDLDGLRLRETQVATDDATCFAEAGLPSIQAEVLLQAESETAAEAQETITAIRRARARALEHARRLALH